jgi:signal recognition particle receptor subunit beta
VLASVLSFFDSKAGPKTLMEVSELPSYLKFDHIALLMDFYGGAFFIHEFGELKTANHIFTIPSPLARGKEETLMISIVMLDEKLYDLHSFRKYLEIFVDEFKKIKDVYKGLHTDLEDFPDANKILEVIKEMFEDFFDSLPKERAIFKQRLSRILLFGLPQSGKSSVIKCLQQKIFDRSTQKKEINLKKSLLGNLSITTYKFSEKNSFYTIMSQYLENIDGLVFILDASDTKIYDKARIELHHINEFPETYNMPLLILLNKMDLETPNITEIIEELKLEQLKQKTIKFFPVSTLKNKGITDAFNWLSTEIINLMIRNPIVYFS